MKQVLAEAIFIFFFGGYVLFGSITPIFGLDPLGTLWDEAPWLLASFNTAMVSFCIWLDWGIYEKDGDFEKFALAALKWVAIGVFLLLMVILDLRM